MNCSLLVNFSLTLAVVPHSEDAHHAQSHGFQQRPHHSLSSGLCLPPTIAFAPLAKLSAQAGSPGGSLVPPRPPPSPMPLSVTPSGAFSPPYVYSPRTVPLPPPLPQGSAHPHLRAPPATGVPYSTPSGFPPGTAQRFAVPPSASGSPQPGALHPSHAGGEFMVLRTDRRTGRLQVAGTSQTEHSGAVQAMRHSAPDSNADNLEVWQVHFVGQNHCLTNVPRT
jgi:hypothetical protein